ncbi:MAG: 50S ribosomal protein L24 [Thermodesulfobacteriota bacterium]|nr:50S ribosomal protein L24 [Thermodesulfobacteriota bacterium]
MKGTKYHIRKDDKVMVTVGKERGKSGKILKVITKKDRVIIEKINMIKRHAKPTMHTGQGGIIEKEGPIHISNVMLICDKCNKPTRTGRRILEDGKRVRFCKRCKEIHE